MIPLSLHRLASPLGSMLLVTDELARVRALDFEDHRGHLHSSLRDLHGEYTLTERAQGDGAHDAALGVEGHLTRYFEGDLDALDGVHVFTHGTPFQQQVWEALRAVPHGRTTTYGQLARQLGLSDPRAAIDVGSALAANPVAIVVPCHRVVGKDGALKGFAWGVHRKRWLLRHEKAAFEISRTLTLPGFSRTA